MTADPASPRPRKAWRTSLLVLCVLPILWVVTSLPHSWESRPEQCRVCRLQRIASRLYDHTVHAVYLPDETYERAVALDQAHEHLWWPAGVGTAAGGPRVYDHEHPLLALPRDEHVARLEDLDRSVRARFADLARRGEGGEPGADEQAAELLVPPDWYLPSRDERAWAEAVQLPGVPNLHQVSEVLYRSAQPDAEGMAALADHGVRTVVNLRSFHSDRDEIGDTGLAYEHLYMKAWHPEWKEAVRFLQIVTDPARQPVLVHCQHGADRTGTMVAVYRMAVQGWSRDEAIAEMTGGGFGYHEIWTNLPAWIRELDIEGLKVAAGLLDAATNTRPPRSMFGG